MLGLVEFEKGAILSASWSRTAVWLGLVEFEKGAIFHRCGVPQKELLGLVEFEKGAIFSPSMLAAAVGWGL